MKKTKYIKIYEEFDPQISDKNIVEEILDALKEDIDQLLKKYEMSFEKTFEREMSETDREMARLNIIWDLVKSVESYTLPSDKLVSIKSYTSPKGNLEILAKIARDGKDYDLQTEVIYAGGHNIQRLHYRYITKTNLPKTGSSEISAEYSEKIKRLTKLEKLEDQISKFRATIQKNTREAEENSKLSDQEIFDLLAKEDGNLGITWDEIVRRGADKNYGSKEQFETSTKDYTKRQIDFWKNMKINSKLKHNETLKSEIKKLEKKISQIT